jgi:hypothetical protein
MLTWQFPSDTGKFTVLNSVPGSTAKLILRPLQVLGFVFSSVKRVVWRVSSRSVSSLVCVLGVVLGMTD